MKFLYFLLALPLLAVAAPYPSGYYAQAKRDTDSMLAKRQATVADLKRRAYDDDHKKHKYKPSGYYPPEPEATGSA